ncbi:MAG: IclR family transcriptional regulator [Sneathiella sp.]
MTNVSPDIHMEGSQSMAGALSLTMPHISDIGILYEYTKYQLEDMLVNTATRSEGPMVLPRAFALLRLLAEESKGLNLSDIATQLEVPKSSLSATLKALTEQEFLIRQGSLYHLGSESFSLASVILAGRSIRQIARPYLEKTMENCGETVLLAVLDSDLRHASYIDIVESPKSVRFTVSIGTRRPLYANACGRLFLAYQPESLRRAYLDTENLKPITEKTVTDRAGIETVMETIREQGISVTLGDYSADSGGFAAPIFNFDGELVAALTIAVPISRGIREEDRFRDVAKHSARAISKTLGYQEDR